MGGIFLQVVHHPGIEQCRDVETQILNVLDIRLGHSGLDLLLLGSAEMLCREHHALSHSLPCMLSQ